MTKQTVESRFSNLVFAFIFGAALGAVSVFGFTVIWLNS